MTDTNLRVMDNLVVSLDYTLRLSDGEVIVNTTADDDGALEFLQGQGEVFPPLEQALYGMAVGDEKDVVLEPADAYGDRDPEATLLVSPEVFPPDMPLEPGIKLNLRDSQGQAVEAYVDEVRPEGVTLDFNHPLAGETLYFHVKVAALRPATSEELAHGHSHSEDDED